MASPLPIELANIGMADSLILMVLALVVFGPRRLPEIGRQIGKLMYEFRKASNDFKFQMEEELRLAEEADRRKKEELGRQQGALGLPVQTVEAQADIGAGEPAGAILVDRTSTPAAFTEPEEDAAVHLPRVAAPLIQPPSTGAPIAAARPSRLGASMAESLTGERAATEASMTAEAHIGAAAESAVASPEAVPSEPASQHG